MAAKAKPVKTEAEVHGGMLEALQSVADEQNVPVEAIIDSIEGALVSAYKRAYGGTGAIRVAHNFSTSEFRVYTQKRVVQTVDNPDIEIAWRDARVDNPGINLGDEVEKEVTPSGFGRIAAQTAKQVLMQRLREAVRFQVASEYADKSGHAFRGTVLRLERGDVIVQVGKAEAVMPRREQVPGEHYRFNETIYVYVLDVRTGFRGPQVRVSRTHPGLVQQLFEREVPEIAEDIVQLKAVAREAGQRTKIAVAASNPDVDPVGACVGPRGNRVGKVVAELGNEKVDIVRWNADPITFISNALSPAQILKVVLTDDKGKDGEAEGTATVVVAEDQQSLAIGKQGQNVRLAAKLTHWRIDIRTEKQLAEEQAKKMFDANYGQTTSPTVVSESKDEHADLFSVDVLDETAPDEDAGSTFDLSSDEGGDGVSVPAADGSTDNSAGGASANADDKTELTPDEVAAKFVEQTSGASEEDTAATDDATADLFSVDDSNADAPNDDAESAAGDSGGGGSQAETRDDL